MAPIDLNRLDVFATVCQTRNFSAAAKRLGVPRSTVSRAIAALEEQVGDKLVERTTRTMAVTEEGKCLFERIAPSLNDLRSALNELPPRLAEPSGTVRVTTTTEVAFAVVVEAAVRFTARYPRANVELDLTPNTVDIVSDGFDLALRASLTKLPDSGLVTRKIGTIAFQLFAAPTYLARRGTPRTPEQVAAHDWVGVRVQSAPELNSTIAKHNLARSRIACNDMFFVRELLRRGGGIGAMPSFLAEEDLRAGTLARVLPKFTLLSVTVHMVQPARKYLPPRVTAFRDIVLELLRERPLAST